MLARGVVLPVQRVARALAGRLLAALERLPDAATDAIEVLDLAETAEVVLDLAESQIALARWWQTTKPASPPEDLVRLRDRLGLSPELGTDTNTI